MLAMEVRAPGTPVRAIPFGEEGLVTGQNIDSDGTSRAAGALQTIVMQSVRALTVQHTRRTLRTRVPAVDPPSSKLVSPPSS